MKKIRRMLGLVVVTMAALGAHCAGAADAQNGQRLYESRCTACHSVDENRVGPAHRGVVGRKAGKQKEYDYSPALAKSKIVWSEKTLDQWLANPERLIAGQKMGYSVTSPQDRADLIAYLGTISR